MKKLILKLYLLLSLFCMISFIFTGCEKKEVAEERLSLVEQIKSDTLKVRTGVVVDKWILNCAGKFLLSLQEEENASDMKSPFNDCGQIEYVMLIHFAEQELLQFFKIIECSDGPGFGHPLEVFNQYKKDDEVNVRISNAESVSSEGIVQRYAGTTHLDKGVVTNVNAISPTNYQTKCAGSFRPTPKTIIKIDSAPLD